MARIEVNALSYSRLEVSFLKFVQPAHRCQGGDTAGRNLGDHDVLHPNFTNKNTEVQRKEMACPHHRVTDTVGTRIQVS